VELLVFVQKDEPGSSLMFAGVAQKEDESALTSQAIHRRGHPYLEAE
jgi:hypothetical protein